MPDCDTQTYGTQSRTSVPYFDRKFIGSPHNRYRVLCYCWHLSGRFPSGDCRTLSRMDSTILLLRNVLYLGINGSALTDHCPPQIESGLARHSRSVFSTQFLSGMKDFNRTEDVNHPDVAQVFQDVQRSSSSPVPNPGSLSSMWVTA